MWQRLELMIASHAQNVINGSGMRKTGIRMRQVLSPVTYQRLRVAAEEAEDAREAEEEAPDDDWETDDGPEVDEILDDIEDVDVFTAMDELTEGL